MRDTTFNPLPQPINEPCACGAGIQQHVMRYYADMFKSWEEIYLCDVCLEYRKEAWADFLERHGNDWWQKKLDREAEMKKKPRTSAKSRSAEEALIGIGGVTKPMFGSVAFGQKPKARKK